MPLDTFARAAVEKICGRASPRLGPGESDEARGLFPDGQPRKFTAAELLFSWTVEPRRWERAPFLLAGYEELRTEVLDLPVEDRHGQRLKHASPRHVEQSQELRRRLREISRKRREARMRGTKYSLTRLEKKIEDLEEAYGLYRLLSFDPAASDLKRSRFSAKLSRAFQVWNSLQRNMAHWPGLGGKKGSDDLVRRASESWEKLAEALDEGQPELKEVEPLVAACRRSAVALADHFAVLKAKLAKHPPEVEKATLRVFKRTLDVLSRGSAELARLVGDAQLALYDNGKSVRLVPALNPYALDADRDAGNDVQPWLNVQALIIGSEDLLRGYPRDEVRAVRQTFDAAKEAYLDRGDTGRAERFSAAMGEFAAAVRSLGEKIEPLREQLPVKNRDEELIALTAYPPPGSTDLEVYYNKSDPFLWAWVVCLGSMLCFALSLGRIRKPMFWLGLLVLLAAQGLIVYGFTLRVIITGWAPVTNMFETVVFSALCVGLLGVWFALLPLSWPGLRNSWRLTAVPVLGEATPLDQQQAALFSPTSWSAAGYVMAAARLGLMVWIFHGLAIAHWGSGGRSAIFALWPSVLSANALLTWLVGLCVLIASTWYLPRLGLTLLLSVGMAPYVLARQGMAKPIQQVYARKVFAVVGSVVAFITAYVAYFAPVFHRDMGPLMPVIRDNFWLTMHVLTITASYGAGALAWGLANVSLGYYLFGCYRDPAGQRQPPPLEAYTPAVDADAPQMVSARRPPEACAPLAGFVYKSIQVSVVLLTIGTILGALWADVSWGRFWGWDPKEVWSLISLLAYMFILHGRYAGWFGNFGLAVGAVLGTTAIVMAWYGVNYILPGGLHSYGEGTGGQQEVLIVAVANWLLVAIAAVRYNAEVHAGVAADQ